MGVQHVWLVNAAMAKTTQTLEYVSAVGSDTDPNGTQPKKRRATVKARAKAAAQEEALKRMMRDAGLQHDAPENGRTVVPRDEAITTTTKGTESNDGISRAVAKQAPAWLTVRRFDSTADCIAALEEIHAVTTAIN